MDGSDALFMGAMGTTVVTATGFDAVPNDLAAAMLAFRSQGVNGTFKAVEIVRNTGDNNLNRLVIFISASFAFVHSVPFWDGGGIRPGLFVIWEVAR